MEGLPQNRTQSLFVTSFTPASQTARNSSTIGMKNTISQKHMVGKLPNGSMTAGSSSFQRVNRFNVNGISMNAQSKDQHTVFSQASFSNTQNKIQKIESVPSAPKMTRSLSSDNLKFNTVKRSSIG